MIDWVLVGGINVVCKILWDLADPLVGRIALVFESNFYLSNI